MRLAAKELRRYVYLRTGNLLPLAKSGEGIALKIDPSLEAQQYRLETAGGTRSVNGGSDLGVLYGAYRYVELLGTRFYLHGDVLPDERLSALPVVNEAGRPRFALRGVHPWGTHLFGLDAWGADDYKAIFSQLVKMRMDSFASVAIIILVPLPKTRTAGLNPPCGRVCRVPSKAAPLATSSNATIDLAAARGRPALEE